MLKNWKHKKLSSDNQISVWLLHNHSVNNYCVIAHCLSHILKSTSFYTSIHTVYRLKHVLPSHQKPSEVVHTAYTQSPKLASVTIQTFYKYSVPFTAVTSFNQHEANMKTFFPSLILIWSGWEMLLRIFYNTVNEWSWPWIWKTFPGE